MCFLESDQNPSTASRRRKAAVVAGSVGALAGLPTLLSSHGHRGVLVFVIAAQLCLIIISLRLLIQSNRERTPGIEPPRQT